MCRLTMSGPYVDRHAAEEALTVCFCEWVAEYASRDHGRETSPPSAIFEPRGFLRGAMEPREATAEWFRPAQG